MRETSLLILALFLVPALGLAQPSESPGDAAAAPSVEAPEEGEKTPESPGESPGDANPAPEAPEGSEGAPESPGESPGEPSKEGEKSEEADAVGTIGKLVDAVREGQWRMVASLALTLLMLALVRVREWGPLKKFFGGDRGGAIFVGVLALAGALASGLASSAPMDWKLFLGAAGVMWTAVGGYTWVKKLIWPADAD